MSPKRLYENIRQRPPCNCENNVFPTFDALNEGIPSSYRVHIWYGKTRTAGVQSREGRIMIDSVVWVQDINVTDSQPSTQSRRDSNSRANAVRSGGKNYHMITSLTFSDLGSPSQLKAAVVDVLVCFEGNEDHGSGGQSIHWPPVTTVTTNTISSFLFVSVVQRNWVEQARSLLFDTQPLEMYSDYLATAIARRQRNVFKNKIMLCQFYNKDYSKELYLKERIGLTGEKKR